MVDTETIGEWAFLAGVLIAVLLGLVPSIVDAATSATVLVVLGVIVGLVSVSAKEIGSFLTAAIALLVAGAAGLDQLPAVGAFLGPILGNISAFVAPAAVVIAVKYVVELARGK